MFALIYFIEFYALSDIDSKVKNSFGKTYDPFISLGKLILIKVLLVFNLFLVTNSGNFFSSLDAMDFGILSNLTSSILILY